MKDIQLDVTDIQVRESFKDVMACLDSNAGDRDAQLMTSLLEEWDFKFTLDSPAASFWLQWERAMGNHFHEMKISSEDFRKSLSNHPAYMSAFYKRVHDWA